MKRSLAHPEAFTRLSCTVEGSSLPSSGIRVPISPGNATFTLGGMVSFMGKSMVDVVGKELDASAGQSQCASRVHEIEVPQ